MRMRDALPPTLGVTGALAMLWLIAVALDGAGSQAARALDPAHGGSIPAIWGVTQLAAVLALALAMGGPGVATMAPALILAGEAGKLHLAIAELLGRVSGLDSAWLKAATAGSLGGAALVFLAAGRRSAPGIGVLLACAALGSAGLCLDLARMHSPDSLRWACDSLEEWCELALASLLAAACISQLEESPETGPIWRVCAHRLTRFPA